MSLSAWEAKLITKSSGGVKICIGIRSPLGEYFCIRVDPFSCTIEKIRKAYWEMKEWEGPPEKSINFIWEETLYFLPNNIPLAKLGIKHGSVLLIVIGNDLRHTGGYQFPPITDGDVPPDPPKNIYRVATDRNATVHTNPPPQDTKRTRVPSYITIDAIVNTPEGTVTVEGNTIIHDASLVVSYFAGHNTPPEFLAFLNRVEAELLQNNPGSQPPELAGRLDESKIGQAMDLEHARKKILRMRTYHPYGLLTGVCILHRDDPKDVEMALHTRNSLLRGGSFGEHFGSLTQVDKHQLVTLGEQMGGATLIFFSVAYLPGCHFGDLCSKSDKKGVVYKVQPDWGFDEKSIFETCMNKFGDEEAYLPFDYNADKANFGAFCNIYLNSFKIGMYSGTDLEEYFSMGILWACGFVRGVLYTSVESKESRKLERMLHTKLNNLGLHVCGEYFLPPSANTKMSEELTHLLNSAPITSERTIRIMKTTHHTLHDWVRRGLISHRIIWECVKEGAILLCSADKRKKRKSWSTATTGERVLCQLPVMDSPTRNDLALVLKSHTLPTLPDDIFSKLEAGMNIKNAGEVKYVTIKVVTSQFTPPTLEKAREDFIAIFTEAVYERVSGNE
jgi:hypothetical protein